MRHLINGCVNRKIVKSAMYLNKPIIHVQCLDQDDAGIYSILGLMGDIVGRQGVKRFHRPERRKMMSCKIVHDEK